MKPLFLLILLSQNGAGDINASFVNTANLEQCQQKRAVIEGIFSSARIPILESHCISSDLRFSEFAHAESTRQKRHFYLINLVGENISIKPMSNWRPCMEAQHASAGENRIYCASSIQTLK